MRAVLFSLRSSLQACWLCWAMAAAVPLSAMEPQLTANQPSGWQRGTTVEFTLTGTRVADAQEILFFTPGFTVAELAVEKETTVKAKVTAAADVPLGIHAFRLRTATGVSNLRTFTIGPFPEVAEKEPNNDFNAPQPIGRNVTVSGVVLSEDVDYFALEAKQGERITAELEGLRLGNTLFDPYLAILRPDRFELARSDDSPLLNQDCLVSLVAPADGTYIVQVRDSTFGGSGASHYRLHIGDFPRPTAIYPPGGRPGEKLTVRCLGDAAGEFTQEVTLPSSGDSYPLLPQVGNAIAPSPNMLRVVDLPNVLEAEPNNDPAQAASVASVPAAFNGILATPGDHDFFRFRATKGAQLDVKVFARHPLRSPLDAVLTIHNDKGNTLASNDDNAGSPDSYLRFSVPADGDYLLAVRDQLRGGGPNYVFRVEVAPPQPAITLNLPERVQYISNTLVVPKNNRMAFLVNVARANIGGPLKLEFPELPPEVTAEALPISAEATQAMVLLHASANAAPSGKLHPVLARGEDPNQQHVGQLHQRTMLIRGQNNQEFWGFSSDRMATVVTDEIPFRVEIVPPKAPLVRDGSLALKVVAQRAADFKGPINLQLLANPAGTSSSTSVVIAEGQTEATIPLTASATAALGTTKIVCLASAPHGNGRVECASPFCDLTILDQFYTFTFERSAIEIGKEAELSIKIEKKADFDGEATATLLGLPVGITTEPRKFTKDTTEIVFPLKADAATAKAGKHGGIVCQTVFAVQGEPVTHTLGKTELRVDQPLPPKPNAPPVVAKPVAPPPAGQPVKRLSRLEQLRLEKTGAADAPPAKP